jgi:formate hydrogenlyase subunit 6/NADH:ubiquinone oxidoreductase subunit I
VQKYEIDTGYCIMCGLCVEACPFNALYMGTNYEAAKYRREELVQQKEDMLYEAGKKTPSGYYYPDFAAALPVQTLLIEKIVEPKPEPKAEPKAEAKAEAKPATTPAAGVEKK